MKEGEHRPFKLSIHHRPSETRSYQYLSNGRESISKNESIAENNTRIQEIMPKLTWNVRSEPSKVITAILVSWIFLRDVSQKWMETI
jgi:hypothetical protein